MSDYNAKNYMEQGGDVWHIGGNLVFDKTAEGVLPNQAASTAGTVSALKDDFNALITALKNYGLMAGDTFTLTYDAVDNDAETVRASNTSHISSVTIANGVITITLDCKVSALKDFDARGGWGVHKWLGIGISAGVTPITGLYYNGTKLTSDDVTEATNVGLSTGYFVRWVAADLVLAGDNTQKSRDTFTLWADNYAQKAYTLRIVEPED